MLSIFIALLVNLFIETSVSFTVVVPRDQIVAHVGSTVTLPCWISPPENAEALEIRWYRHDQFSNPVLFYKHGKIQDLQEESYRNRTSLTRCSGQSGGLKDGDVSLQLEKLTVQDEGSFHCYVSGESTYGSQEMVLKITALGSAPVLFPQPLYDGRVNISCRSSGWYPEPNIMWRSDERTALRPGGASRRHGADKMFSVHSWTVVSHSDTQLVSCSMSLKTGEFREGRLNIQAIISSGSSDPWMALFFIILIIALGLVGLILYKYRHKLTGKKTAKKVCEDESMAGLTAVKDTNTEELEKDKVCEDEPMEKLTKEVVGDVNIEELRKHADQISIVREKLNQHLIVTEDCKTVRNNPDFKHNIKGFSYHLCAFGAQRFTSGRHYWEVSLAQEDTDPKNYWLIGVMRHGRVRMNKSVTPSNGFWFLCSDGPNGFNTSSDPPVKLSLTPRPERLGVLFDYDDGQLSFYNVKEKKHLLTMSTRFTGSVVPLFNPGVGDQSTLKILDCPKPVESPEESSQPLLINSSNPEESPVEIPASVESPVESSQPLLNNITDA
ncbi:butyrophilin subfamily 2 member A2-like [Chanodichthys erythropterus]|uniref:butyrophilin subfamily 2 member A2-like n=1 Tax=Chanodichthys erythropterus TaxID=933992 RepID=UPI00351F3AD5